MAKRRKKKNNTANSQPTTPPEANMASESSTPSATPEESQSSEQPAAERVAVAATSANAGSPGFLQGTKEEFEKVVWPDRQQLISESIAVFLMVSLSAFIFSFIDNLFRWVSTLVFG